ncbi:hypothetical protein OUZ56_029384 [Daphnia magna]|uniref:Uncharacterized protein n=1 Tax=Daphnia magna TaxID=35525 RepID=A0ABR0B6M6_9CRUS|nr:hypothetical protein OUZ56_029384 [Daphnia magna]
MPSFNQSPGKHPLAFPHVYKTELPGATWRDNSPLFFTTLAYLFISHSANKAASFATYLCRAVSYFPSVFSRFSSTCVLVTTAGATCSCCEPPLSSGHWVKVSPP